MRVRSVKLLRDRVTMTWETPVGESGEVIESTIKNGEDPAPELAAALADLHGDTCEILEFPKAYRETFTLKGIAISYAEGGSRGVTFIGSKKLKSGRAVTINTPDMRELEDHEDKGTSFMSDELVEKVDRVIAYAKQYAEGVRAQTVLEIDP